MVKSGNESGSLPERGAVPEKVDLSPAFIEAVRAFAQQLGAAIGVLNLYPPGHSALEPVKEELYHKLESVLAMESPVIIGISQDRILVRGQCPVPGGIMVDRCVNFFHRLGVAIMSIRAPVSRDVMDRFLDHLAGRNKRFTPEELPAEDDFPGISISLVNYSRVLGETIGRESGGTRSDEGRRKMWESLMADFLAGGDGSPPDGELLNIISLMEDEKMFSEAVTAAMNQEKGPDAVNNLAGLLDSARNFFVDQLGIGEGEYLRKMKHCVLSLPRDIRLQLLEVPDNCPDKGEIIQLMARTLSHEEVLSMMASFCEMPDASAGRLARIMGLLLHDKASGGEIMHSLKEKMEAAGPVDRQKWLEMEKLLSSSSSEYVSESYSRQLEEIAPGGREETDMGEEDMRDMAAFTESLAGDNVGGETIRVQMEMLFLVEEESSLESLLDDLGRLIGNMFRQGRYRSAAEALLFIEEHAADGPEGLSDERTSGIKAMVDDILGEETIGRLLDYAGVAREGDLPIIGRVISSVPEAAVRVLMPALAGEEDHKRRQFIGSILAGLGRSSRDEAVKLLGDSRSNVVRNMLAFLVEVGDEAAVPGIASLVKHREVTVRKEAVRALTAIGSAGGREALFLALDDENEEIAQLASDYLGSTEGRGKLIGKLLDWTGQSNLFGFRDGQVKRAVVTLGKIRAVEAEETLKMIMMKRRWLVSAKKRYRLASAAARALYDIGDTRSLDALRLCAEKGRGPVAEKCRKLLEKKENESR